MAKKSSEGIHSVPWLKTVLGAFRFIENPIPVVDQAIRNYGPTYSTRVIGGRRIIMTTEPEVIRHILQKNNRNYIKSEMQTESLGRYVGQGLLTTNGAYWLRQRRLIQPGFHKEKLASLVSIMENEIIKYCEGLESKVLSGEDNMDISQEMMRLTLLIVSRSLFSTGISDDQIVALGQKFTTLQRHIVREIRQPFLNFWRNWTGKRRRALQEANEIQQLVLDIIQERKSSKEKPGDLLDMLLAARYEDTGRGMTDQQLLDEAIILFTAGHETTANALTWSLFLLDQNPEKAAILRTEIDGVKENFSDLNSLSGLEYTRQVISESMRLYPPAWILDRRALMDDQIGQININAGDLIGLYVYGTHRDPTLWEDPKDFIPERFSPTNQKNHKAFSYLPFGGGPRLCIGNHFALLEMQLALYHLYKKFRFSLVPEQAISLEPLITLRPKYGIKMIVSLR